MFPNVGRTPRWRLLASGARCSSSHRKPVGMRRMQSGNTVMEGAAVAGQIARKTKNTRGKDMVRMKIIKA